MRIALPCITVFTASLLAACGGSDSPAASTAAPATPTTPVTTASTTISGSAVKGPVANATVTVKNAATGAVLTTGTTGAAGTYSLQVPFQGDVIVEVSGGTYTDEATGVATPLSTPMRAVLNADGGNVTGVVTPLTTMAYTTAFGAGGSVTSAAYKSAAARLATQFQLGSVDLTTTLPTVTGDANTYGKAVRGISKYLQQQNTSLQSLINASLSAAQLSAFSTAYTSAYNAINPGSPVTFSFDNGGVNIGGTGAGGGTGSCGVNVRGNVSTAGFTVPLNLDYCISGMTGGSCDAGNSSLSQALSGQGGVAGAANLSYTYSASCAANAIAIRLQ